MIENFKNGVKEGYEISYHNNGNIKAEGNFKKGNLDGVYKVYDKAGKFSFEGRSTNEEVQYEPNMEDTTNYGVYKVLARNTKWKKTLIVTTSSSFLNIFFTGEERVNLFSLVRSMRVW